MLGFGTAATAAPITYEVFIQPIQICDDAGNNCATPTKELFEAEGDKIWAQAGIDLKFLSWTSVNETDFLDLRVDQDNNNFIDPGEDFDILRSDPTSYGGSGDAMVLNMWFADLLDSSASDRREILWSRDLPQHFGSRYVRVNDRGSVLMLDEWTNVRSRFAVLLVDRHNREVARHDTDAVRAALSVTPAEMVRKAKHGVWITAPPVLPGDGKAATVEAGGRTLAIGLADGPMRPVR